MSVLRVHLTGALHIERAPALIHGSDLPGRQGRRALTWLALNRTVPSTREALAEAVWGENLPPNWQAALSPLLSKLRRLLEPFDTTIDTTANTHQLRFPADTWVDTEVAISALESATVALRAERPADAFGHIGTTLSITRQPLLPAESGDWLDFGRDRLLRARASALELLADIWLARAESALAVEAATELTRLEPFRDSGYQRLMRAHMQRGDRAQAIRVFVQFQRDIAEEMGVDPAAETSELYLAALRS